MAKKKSKKRKNISKNYEVGYCKPPKEYQWVKGCKSPNPKGRPKKITNIKEALQVSLGKEITARNENGEPCKISCAEALARKTVADAISKDGPTRRLFFSRDFINMEAKEPEIIYEPSYAEKKEVEETYGKLLMEWASMPAKDREFHYRLLSEILRDELNEGYRSQNNNLGL